MKKIYILSLSCFFIFLFSCTSDDKFTESEKQIIDSISKVEQKFKADSLKRNNPLLIVAPDTNYTGDYVDKYLNGITKFKGYFRFGKRHGQWLSFYPNGLMWSEMFYDKGLRDGKNTTYFENGKIRYIGFYKNNLQDSIWTYFDTIGKVATTLLYQKDRIVKKIN